MKKHYILLASILVFFSFWANAQSIITEDFENAGAIPVGWTQEYVNGTVDYTFDTGGNTSFPAAAHTGTYNALLFDGASGTGYKTKLISPEMDLTGYTENIELTFWHTQAIWQTDQDKLKVYYRTSNVGAWIPIAEYTESITEWAKETITLPSVSSTYYIAFEGETSWGYGVCIDDVEVKESVFSGITACGTITSNTIWNTDVHVNCDVTVDEGVTLTILPGVEVEFQGHYNINVLGGIIAEGTAQDTIVFTSHDELLYKWAGITYHADILNEGISSYKYCKFEYSNIDTTDICNPDTLTEINLFFHLMEYGGGAFNLAGHTGSIVFENSLFQYNISCGDGGAINFSTEVDINNCIFKNNTAIFSGGAIAAKGTTNINNNIIIDNLASTGGGIDISSCSANITSNLISNNECFRFTNWSRQDIIGNGGAIYIHTPESCFINNNIMVNNYADDNGGAIFMTDISIAKFSNNTISNNYAGFFGGGLYIYNTSSPDFYNTIFYGNRTPSVDNGHNLYLNEMTTVPNFYNCIVEEELSSSIKGAGGGDDYHGTQEYNLMGDPNFVSPSASAGSGAVGYTADWSLNDSSACINKGSTDTLGLYIPSTDYLGNTRFFNGRIDIGAIENQEIQNMCGHIDMETTWDADTIKVTCDIIIDEQQKLTINPGTYVEFQGFYKIKVKGSISAEGTADNRITFSIKDTTGFYNDSSIDGAWNGIELVDIGPAQSSSNFAFCNFEYAKALDVSAVGDMHAEDTLVKGGAICIINSQVAGGTPVSVANCIFTNNKAYKGGGAIYCNSTKIIISSCLFTNNTANGMRRFYTTGTPYAYGGAIFIEDCSPSIENSTIVNNYSNDGGGICLDGNGTADVKSCIIYGNQSDAFYGKNIYVGSVSTTPSFSYCDLEGGINSIGIYGTSTFPGTSSNILDTIPMFVNPTTDIGAGYDASLGDWTLQTLSPCINAGNGSSSSHDLNGNPRTTAQIVDLGAYENQMNYHFIENFNVTDTLCEGMPAVFVLNLVDQANDGSSSSEIIYQWQHNGANILGATNNSLEIANTDNTDLGTYNCIFTNNFGSLSTDTFNLVLNYHPRVTSQPADTTIKCVGEFVQLNPTYSGTEPITYQWYNSYGTILGATNEDYVIYSALEAHENQYYCIAENSCDTTRSRNAVLTVNEPVEISTESHDISNCENTSSFFSVTVNSNATLPITYQWKNDDGAVAGETNNIYTISSTDVNDANNYWCEITNSCGTEISDIKTLTVKALPNISTQSASSVICENQGENLYVTATGANPLSFQWFHNSSSVSGATNNNYLLNNISSADGGDYYCVATNACGTDQGDVTTLTVNIAPSITTEPVMATACIGGINAFSITAEGTTPLSYQWYNSDSIVTGATNNTYVINTIEENDANNYYCVITNVCGTSQSQNASLTVNTLPVILSVSDDFETCVGNSAVLNVTTNETSPTYQWYGPNGAITGAINNFTILNSIASNNAGDYNCIVTNTCGNTQSDVITITVNEPITITQQSSNVSSCEGSNIDFFVKAIGSPTITYQWFNVSGEILGLTNDTISIANVNSSDEGYYYCELTNTCGTVQSSYKTLTVNENPIVDLGNDTVMCGGSTINLSPGNGYFCEWSNGSYMPQITVAASGSYFVQVEDMNGCEGTSNTINIQINEPYANSEICLVLVDSTENKNLIVWEPTEDEGIVGYNIYKKEGGSYDLIGNVPFADAGTFLDLGSEPYIHADKYKISIIDTCGNESNMSPFHQTMNLSTVLATEGISLIWNKYIDESEDYVPDYYYLYRGMTRNTLTAFDSITGDLSSYNFDVPNAQVNELFLVVNKKDLACNPQNGAKLMSGPYDVGLSNIEDNIMVTTNISNINNDNGISVFPNPATNQLSIINYQLSIIEGVEIFDVSGRNLRGFENLGSLAKTKLKIDISNLPTGIYFIKVKTNKSSYVQKFVKE